MASCAVPVHKTGCVNGLSVDQEAGSQFRERRTREGRLVKRRFRGKKDGRERDIDDDRDSDRSKADT